MGGRTRTQQDVKEESVGEEALSAQDNGSHEESRRIEFEECVEAHAFIKKLSDESSI